ICPAVRTRILGSIFVLAVSLPQAFSQILDENPFNAQIHLELSPSTPVGLSPAATVTRSQARSAEHLRLARIYADANRAEAAITEYATAVDADDAQVRAAALAETKNL